jgi:hypothetical protein
MGPNEFSALNSVLSVNLITLLLELFVHSNEIVANLSCQPKQSACWEAGMWTEAVEFNLRFILTNLVREEFSKQEL